jgi:chemotaxis signal transduction protein
MSDPMNDAMPGQALMSPVDALRRGFQFDGQDAAGTALAAAYGASVTEAVGQGAAGELLQREGFQLGHLGLMIRYEDGSELADMPTTYRLPNAPDWFVGVANLHGLLVPVLDLAGYLGIERQEGAKPMLLVLGHGADAAGVVIDGLPLRLRVRPDDRAEGAPVPAALEGCVGPTYWVGERTWTELQVDALLGKLSDELAAMGQ